MTIRPILTWPNDALRMTCARVQNVGDVDDLANDMLETMYDAPGRGLAAPQIGVDARLFVMDAAWKVGDPAPWVCINPTLHQIQDDIIPSEEGCLSLPNVTAVVQRSKTIRMDYTDLAGQRHDVVLTGFEALCAQHEVDHLDGVLIFDHLEDSARNTFFSDYGTA